MRPNPVKQRILAGEIAIGTFAFEFATMGLGRIVAAAGSEFIIYDMEHTGWSLETIRMLIATTRSTNTLPFVRVPSSEYHFISGVLDAGAMGVMIPMVETPEQARAIVSAAKYPPLGRRGAAFGIAHDDYTNDNLVETIHSANRENLLMAQIETARGVDNVQAIAAVPGIDVLWIGHFDLTNSLGIPGQFEHPLFLAAIDKVLTACRDSHKVPGYMASSVRDGTTLINRGFRIVAYSGDLWIYQNALRAGITGLRESMNGSGIEVR